MSSRKDKSAGLAPISTPERIDVLDILRGFALIGVLLMNIEWFGRPISEITTFDSSLRGLDHAVGWLVRCFVEGKFYKLFALLFGMGFAIMLVRAKERGQPFTAWFSRRMIVLFAIGLLHMIFLWTGDILHDYAISGLLFLGLLNLFRRKRFRKFNNPKSFLKIGLIWLFLPLGISVLVGIWFGTFYDPADLQTRWEKEQKMLTQSRLIEQSDEVTPEENESHITTNGDLAEEELTPEEQIAKKAREKFEERQEKKEKSEEKSGSSDDKKA